MDALQQLTEAVARLESEHEALLAACTDPQATDMAELFDTVKGLRERVQAVERDVEAATAKAMLGDYAETGTLRVERYRSADRKAWDHERWQADVRAKVLQASGLKGAQGVLTADGEVADPEVLHELMRAVEAVHSAGAPKTSKTAGLRAYGLDPDDYCETTKGSWHVKVTRMADETETEQAVA